mgnify:CR=1 FL=1
MKLKSTALKQALAVRLMPFLSAVLPITFQGDALPKLKGGINNEKILFGVFKKRLTRRLGWTFYFGNYLRYFRC